MRRETDFAGRRRLLAAGLGGAGLGLSGVGPAWSQGGGVQMPFANGERRIAAYPGKRPMIVLTSRPPQLETPFEVFNEGLFTPNDAFFVRYHNAGIPTSIDPDTYEIKIGGSSVAKPYTLTLAALKTEFVPVELNAVNQCSGNSRAFFSPRVTGGQLGNGAMGNARWVGVRLKDILARAEPKDSAKQVTFDGLDTAIFGGGDFVKALDINQATDPDVLVAYRMNGEDLPMLNGYPVRLVVPGYYGTYWVKHLSQIDVIDKTFDGFWVATGYRVPDNDCHCVLPGNQPAKTAPIGRFTVRSFITSVGEGQRVPAGTTTLVRGIAFDGGTGIKDVGYSTDGGQSWFVASLGPDMGRYSFREFTFPLAPKAAGPLDLRTCAYSKGGEVQPSAAVWQAPGYMRNVVESVKVVAA